MTCNKSKYLENPDCDNLLEIAKFSRQFGETGKLIESYSLLLAEQNLLENNLDKNLTDNSKDTEHVPYISELDELAKKQSQLIKDPLFTQKLDDLHDHVHKLLRQRKSNRLFTFVIKYRSLLISILCIIFILFASYPFIYPTPWRAAYFQNADLSGLPFGTYHESIPNHDWGQNSPKPGMPVDYFSVRWESLMILSEDTDVNFSTLSDDGVRLFLDSELLINQWKPTNSLSFSVTKGLKAGTYRIKLEYFDQERDAKVFLKISSTGSKQPKFVRPE
ncbi:MAG TPA: PA14 domain-containing protein [Oligoflexia bacterium]|nr:PA14 domain-containing protein [Oligoflexia bacterium]HMP47561.1 PA14 domain-containing protein [Oligoflexia bacterium]